MTEDGSANVKFVHNLKPSSSLRLVFPRVASKKKIPSIRIRNRNNGIDFAIGSTVRQQLIVRKCTYEVKNEFSAFTNRKLRKNLTVRKRLTCKPELGDVTPVPKLNLHFSSPPDFMQEFESRLDEFSDSWREAMKEIKLNIHN